MRIIKKGATSQTIYFEVLDSTSTTGGRKTGLAFNTSGLLAYYVRNQGSATAITLATLSAANSAWSSGGFKEVDSTNMPGVYRVDVPDAAFAAGADSVVVTLSGATGMAQVSMAIQLVAVDLQDATRFGLSALPNASAGASGGLPTGDASGLVALQADQAVNVTKVNGTAQTAKDLGASATQTGDTYARLGAPAGASVSADIAAVKTDSAAIKTNTDNLPPDPADESLIIAATDSLATAIAAIPTATDNADALLTRDMSAVAEPTGVRFPLQALRFLRNAWSISAGELTVKKEDDTTTSWQSTVTQTAGADPVTASDPD